MRNKTGLTQRLLAKTDWAKPMMGHQERVRKPADLRGRIHRVLHRLPHGAGGGAD